MADVTQPCDLHELTGCSICSGLDKKLAAEEKETFTVIGPAIRSEYPGKCPKCGDFFPGGTAISYTEAGWICCP
jgi:hypothetical protein